MNTGAPYSADSIAQIDVYIPLPKDEKNVNKDNIENKIGILFLNYNTSALRNIIDAFEV